MFRAAGRSLARPSLRVMTTVSEVTMTAEDARKVSGYNQIDFTIDENALVIDAVQKFAAYNIGALVTIDSKGKLLF